MPDRGRDKYVKCPFYQDATKNIIKCESFLKNNAISHGFGVSGEKLEYMKTYCNRLKGYPFCPFYKMIMSVIGDQDE